MNDEQFLAARREVIEAVENESWYPAHEVLDDMMEDALLSVWVDRGEHALAKVSIVAELLRRRTAEGWTVWHA